MDHVIKFLPEGVCIRVEEGTSVLAALVKAGLHTDAPCAGHGTCGKCRVELDGRTVLACQTRVDRAMTVTLPQDRRAVILTGGEGASVRADGAGDYALAVDVGTTTVVAYLLDGHTGVLLDKASRMNPQTRFGADVISRIQYAMDQGMEGPRDAIRSCIDALGRELALGRGIDPGEITTAAVVGNTAMHHLLLGIDPRPLITPPYMPAVSGAMELCHGSMRVRVLPNIAGFVGGDTVGCMVATRFDQLEDLTLLIDIGTNGEMVLGNKHRRIACSTAAGPAFEGAKISCGMRGAAGAVDHVWIEDGQVRHSVIGGGEAAGLCGSGLLDLVAVLLELGIIEDSGRLNGDRYTIPGTTVTLTQRDVREVQLAKAAIRAGIELMCQELGVRVEEIRRVCLAGAFGNYLDPESACAIGMIPPVLLDRITPIGNAAGEGAKSCALSAAEFEHSSRLASGTRFLELASRPDFQDCFVDALEFCEEDVV